MTDIFAPADLSGIRLSNRILRSATAEVSADEEGFPTNALAKRYEALAKGGVGGIITGSMGVAPEGKATLSSMVLIDSDDKVGPLSKVVERVHAAGAPIIAQIAHCGRAGVGGKAYDVNKLSADEIERISMQFIEAARRAHRAGFDGVQVHCAHGYLLSEMLSPATNHRHDEWGGSEEGRFRLTGQILRGIRAELPGFPVLVKMHGEDDPKEAYRTKSVSGA